MSEVYVLIGLLSYALLIVSISACRTNRCKHFLTPLDFSPGCIWFKFNYFFILPPLAWVSTCVSFRVCSADWLRRLVPISSMAAVWVCTAVLFISSIPERTFSWMKFSSCTEHTQAVNNIVSYGNPTSDLPHCLHFLPCGIQGEWRCGAAQVSACVCSHSRPYVAMQSQTLLPSEKVLFYLKHK